MIELAEVRYRYTEDGPAVLGGVSFTLGAGELLLVVGPSGSGKSTLLRCLDGLVPHFHGGVLAGRVRVGGRDPVALGPHAMSDAVGFVFQDPEAQFVADRVEDELAFALENHDLPLPEMERRIGEVLGHLGIEHLRRRRLNTLSGGERQRVALGSVLTLRPELLVLDEPTSQLDPPAAAELMALLRRLNRESGLTVVLSEHRLERVARWADRVCWLPGPGQPPRVGSPREVLAAADLGPPVTRLARRLGWHPPPLTVEEARELAAGGISESREPAPGRPGPAGEARGDPAVLAARDLTYRYPGAAGDALSGVDLTLHPGGRVALMGPNGGGKSTLLKCLVGLLEPRRGTVEVLGRDRRGRALTEITAEVGFVPQNPARLLFNDTVAGEVRFTRASHGLPPPEEDPPALLGRLGLAHRAATHPRDLSTGERQRAALAAILAAEPRALLLDEPTRGLDAVAKEALAGLLAELAAAGVSVLLATHDVELVARWARRVVRIEDGRVADDGPAGRVLPRLGELAPQIWRLFRDPARMCVEDMAMDRGRAPGRPETAGEKSL